MRYVTLAGVEPATSSLSFVLRRLVHYPIVLQSLSPAGLEPATSGLPEQSIVGLVHKTCTLTN